MNELLFYKICTWTLLVAFNVYMAFSRRYERKRKHYIEEAILIMEQSYCPWCRSNMQGACEPERPNGISSLTWVAEEIERGEGLTR